jgi:hypothetical protein
MPATKPRNRTAGSARGRDGKIKPGLDFDGERLMKNINGADPFGLEAMLKRKVAPARRGRPVKNRDDQRKSEQMSLLAGHK